jgi:glutathione synthase/RimK-type ligase-like ATP-grasp enzyme
MPPPSSRARPKRCSLHRRAAGDAILKPLDGMGGSQIFRVRRDDPNRNVIVETLTQDGARTIMAQRYLPEIARATSASCSSAAQPVPFALARIPKPGETRGNLAAGGTGVAQPLSPATARSPSTWRRSSWRAACCWSASTSSATA